MKFTETEKQYIKVGMRILGFEQEGNSLVFRNVGSPKDCTSVSFLDWNSVAEYTVSGLRSQSCVGAIRCAPGRPIFT